MDRVLPPELLRPIILNTFIRSPSLVLNLILTCRNVYNAFAVYEKSILNDLLVARLAEFSSYKFTRPLTISTSDCSAISHPSSGTTS